VALLADVDADLKKAKGYLRDDITQAADLASEVSTLAADVGTSDPSLSGQLETDYFHDSRGVAGGDSPPSRHRSRDDWGTDNSGRA
jgi:hypothetical protein